MINCPNPYCQTENPNDAKYCHMCGQKLHENMFVTFLKNYKGEIICGIGFLGMVLVILGSFMGNLARVALGLGMMGTAILSLNKQN